MHRDSLLAKIMCHHYHLILYDIRNTCLRFASHDLRVDTNSYISIYTSQEVNKRILQQGIQVYRSLAASFFHQKLKSMMRQREPWRYIKDCCRGLQMILEVERSNNDHMGRGDTKEYDLRLKTQYSILLSASHTERLDLHRHHHILPIFICLEMCHSFRIIVIHRQHHGNLCFMPGGM